MDPTTGVDQAGSEAFARSSGAPSVGGFPSATVWLLRHGQSVWNEEGLAQGQTEAAPGLTERGRRQALAAATELEDAGISVVLSSDLLRAEETARIVADHLGVEMRLEPRLRERALGVAEGRPARELTGPHGGGGVERGRVVDADARPRGGESIRQLVHRVSWYLDDLLRDGTSDRLLLVTHGGVVRAALAVARRTDVELMPWAAVSNAQAVELRLPPPSGTEPDGG